MARALEQLGPPSILVDRSFRVLHMSDTAGRYLQPSGGHLSANLTDLARPELRFDLRSCLQKAFDRSKSELSLPIAVKFNGHPVRVQIMVRPLQTSINSAEQAVVFFIEGGAVIDGVEQPALDGQGDGGDLRALQEELELARSHLRTSHEEFEAATEELRAANEELQSINEEYRSTAEELETSKEELQSINEELQTVNSELKLKLESVSRVNSDLQNLMSATDVGTLFLDSGLKIKRFTPPLADLFNITANDEGRSITDFTQRLDYASFADDARQVLQTLVPVEREASANGRWYLTRLRPYRTIDDRIDGVVATFIDVTVRRAAEEEVRAGAARQQLLMQELSHRVKNTLAVVQSMARLSFRDDLSREEALRNFNGRIAALSQAHDLLIDGDWKGAELTELVRRQLGPSMAESRVTLSGPAVTLPPAVATPFALIIHELATNAMKNGALSVPDGTLSLSWTLVAGENELLDFLWRERGASAKPPGPAGFGSHLVEKGLPQAEVSREFGAEGVTCRIRLPLKGGAPAS